MSGDVGIRERTVRLSAKIICNERSSIFDCVVRSLSREGARIEMPSTLGVPRSFHLRIKPTSAEYECELVARDERNLTVTFGFQPNIARPQGAIVAGLGSPAHQRRLQASAVSRRR